MTTQSCYDWNMLRAGVSNPLIGDTTFWSYSQLFTTSELSRYVALPGSCDLCNIFILPISDSVLAT